MTLRPHPDANVRGTDAYPRYKVSGWCAHPYCRRAADHVHHVWRRSMFGGAEEGGGDYAWVVMSDGRVFANLIPLCWQHHQEIDQNKAKIVLRPEEAPHYLWDGVDWNWQRAEPLKWQPPKPDMQAAIDGTDELHANVTHISETCPTCKRRLPVPREKLEPARPKATWSVKVPKDEREDGVEVIETLLIEARRRTGRGEHRSWRYYTLVEALAGFVANE